VVLSGGAVGAALAAQAAAAVPPPLLTNTARAALLFAARTPPAALSTVTSPAAVTLARGVLNTMLLTKAKSLGILVVLVSMLTAGALLLAGPAPGDPAGRPAANPDPKEPRPEERNRPAVKPDDKPPRPHCIILWMNGGPSQMDTFDLKPGKDNGGPFKEIDTAVKGVRISEHLPRLAKRADRLAIIRSLTHSEGDHARATHLMRTGYVIDQQTDYPTLGSLLAKELGDAKSDLPPYVRISGSSDPGAFLEGYRPGFLGPSFGPLVVPQRAVPTGEKKNEAEQTQQELPAEAFEVIDKGRAKAMRKAVLAAFDLSEEKDAVRDAYGRNPFGQGCLAARRLVEHGAPVVEVTLGGWDTHAQNFDLVKKLSDKLDPAWATLLAELEERKLLDSTLVVWMGEFGRTPRINAADGRDHWPGSFSVVLAGRGIKGGQVIGRTNDDGITIQERPVSPPELMATIFQALGIDPAKENRSNIGGQLPLVLKGTKPVKEALK
jgi:uncharacterized protein (DUF1501 family)